jgi:hypothetical protein
MELDQSVRKPCRPLDTTSFVSTSCPMSPLSSTPMHVKNSPHMAASGGRIVAPITAGRATVAMALAAVTGAMLAPV